MKKFENITKKNVQSEFTEISDKSWQRVTKGYKVDNTGRQDFIVPVTNRFNSLVNPEIQKSPF